MKELRESDENFTNFSISEILKPEFGQKQLTVGVLNLSRDRNAYGQTNLQTSLQYQSHGYSMCQTVATMGCFNFDLFARERLNALSNLQRTVNSVKDLQTFPSLSPANRQGSSLSLDLSNKHDNSFSPQSRTGSRCRRDSSGSAGSSPVSSPATSPSASCASSSGSATSPEQKQGNKLWPAWVYCTRYSDRPSAGPRSRKIKRKERTADDKRPRTAFSSDQLRKLKAEFEANKYLTESRRLQLARELNLNESQIKIWFQNKRAKIKKCSGEKNELAMELIAQGLYNHKTTPVKMEES